MSLKIKRKLQGYFPQIHDELERAATIPRIKKRSNLVLPEAVVRVVIGQMLSGKAADTIYNRVSLAAKDRGLAGSWMLDFQTLRSCGLSQAKANAIVDIYLKVGGDTKALNYWFDLPPAELIDEIRSYRGMGVWSASILALFYIGHEDIFPEGDGSLQRAIRLIAQKNSSSAADVINVALATPHRSYLALYLWKILDERILK